MKRTVILSHTALKQIMALDPVWQEAVDAKLTALAMDPDLVSRKRLQNSPYLSMRVGMYRVIHTDDGLIVAVVEIGRRDKVYKEI